MSLRSTLEAVTIIVVTVALLVTAAFIGLTTVFHQTTANAASAVESVRLAEELEIDLLLHIRTTDAVVRRDTEKRISQTLRHVLAFATNERERGIVEEASARANAYLASARNRETPRAQLVALEEEAFGALEELVDLNLAQARNANARAAAWDRRATWVGAGVGALLLLGAAAILIWLKRRAFEPIFSLSLAMERFGKGDRESRAPETGPAELREISQRFNEMAQALAARRQAQVAFLGGVAHDLRNPLSVLQMAVALVRPDAPLPPEPQLRRMIERIGRQISRLDRMAGDFIDMAKIEAGQLELRSEIHDARQLLANVVELFETVAPKPTLLVKAPKDPVNLYCDQLRVEQVLTNLISNAIKYSPNGSAVEVSVERRADEVVFRVTDHGIGIPESERKTLFDPFRRLGLSKEAIPGVGLGLFVVRRIVEAHAGRIDIASTPGEGSTFAVHLPLRLATRGLAVVHSRESHAELH